MVLRYLPILLILAAVLYVIYRNKRSMKSDPKFITMPLPGDRKAVTMPPFGIYVEKDVKDNPQVIKHEKCHWDQYQRKGLVDFYKEYIKLKSNHDYNDNPMEQECFIAEMN